MKKWSIILIVLVCYSWAALAGPGPKRKRGDSNSDSGEGSVESTKARKTTREPPLAEVPPAAPASIGSIPEPPALPVRSFQIPVTPNFQPFSYDHQLPEFPLDLSPDTPMEPKSHITTPALLEPCPQQPMEDVIAKLATDVAAAVAFLIGDHQLPSPPSPKIRVPSPSVPSCCTSTSMQDTLSPREAALIPALSRGTPDRDPFLSGYSDTLKFTPFQGAFQKGEDRIYIFTEPETIGVGNEVPAGLELNLPPRLPSETANEYYYRRLRDTLPPSESASVDDVYTFAGKGSLSVVYFYHPPAPPPQQLAAQYPNVPEDQRRKAWAKDHSSEVVKLRRDDPFDETGESAMYRSAWFLTRDLAVTKNAEALLKNFQYFDENNQPKPLIQIATYKENFDEIGKGILRQRAVKGKTVYEIAHLIQKSVTSSAAEEYLNRTFGSVNNAKRALAGVEAFCFEISSPLLKLQVKNRLPTVGGRVMNPEAANGKQVLVNVGDDFNGGVNVIHDEMNGIFVYTDP